jgi:hypothetical protein
MLGLRVLETYGRGYTSRDVAQEWLRGMPFHMVYTAERVAYRNLVRGVQPPATASRHNPYREWIGAMIRADIFGYVSPGDPQAAAVLSYQDAALSHTANGIYGEMWAAALVAAAFASSSGVEALEQAVLVVPTRSRLSESLRLTLSTFAEGGSWEDAMQSMEKRLEGYHWVHTINNAEVVSAALLWGDGDFSRTIGRHLRFRRDVDIGVSPPDRRASRAGGVIMAQDNQGPVAPGSFPPSAERTNRKNHREQAIVKGASK